MKELGVWIGASFIVCMIAGALAANSENQPDHGWTYAVGAMFGAFAIAAFGRFAYLLVSAWM